MVSLLTWETWSWFGELWVPAYLMLVDRQLKNIARNRNLGLLSEGEVDLWLSPIPDIAGKGDLKR